MCLAPAVATRLLGARRAAALTRLALDRLLNGWSAPTPSAVLLAVSDRYVGESGALGPEGTAFLDEIRGALPSSLRGCAIELFPYGRAGGGVALRRAMAYLGNNQIVVWGGVDTWYDWPALESLERAKRLLTAANIDGIRPGEAAAVTILGQPRPETVRVLGVGTGREPHPLGSDQPCRSLGLSDALAAAVAPLRAANRRTNSWLFDSTHEAFATEELQNIIARFGDVLGLQTELQMPLKMLGDVGAAAMPLLAVLSAEAWRLGFAEDVTAVLTGCSSDGARAAMLLGAPGDFRAVERVEKSAWVS